MADSANHNAKTLTGFEAGPSTAIAILIFVLIQLTLVHATLASLIDGRLWDSDSYMWLNRVEHLWASWAWFDPVFPRLNPPEGFVQHWTRPMDAIFMAGAWPLSHWLGFKDALYWWSLAVNPILLALSLVAIIFATRPIVPRAGLGLTAVVFVCQVAVNIYFTPARPDHHALLTLLFILLTGLTIRVLLQPEARREAWLAGLVGALGLWVSVQLLPLVVLTIAILGLFWILGDRRLAAASAAYAVTLTVGLGAALLAERGGTRLEEIEFDTLSIAHLIVFGLDLAFWTTVLALQGHWVALDRLLHRLTASCVGAAVALSVLLLTLPRIFANPMIDVDPLFLSVYLERISERQPLIGFDALAEQSWGEAVAKLFFWLGIAVPTLPYLGYRILTERGPARRPWVLMGLLALANLVMALSHLRWVIFAVVALVPAYAALVAAALAWLSRRRLPELSLGVARPLALAVFCLWSLPLLALSSEPEKRAQEVHSVECPRRSLITLLGDPRGLGATPKRLLVFIELGAEVLYRTPHSVFSIPNHRFQSGFATSYDVMTTTDFGRAHTLLRASGIELIAICPGSFEETLYDTAGEGHSFYEALSTDEPPAFVEPLPLPEEVSKGFRLFAVNPSTIEHDLEQGATGQRGLPGN
jgi:hypothetical protein